jgi:triosephosphate isomerase
VRKHLIVANWKMHKTAGEATDYVRRLSELIQPQHVDLVLAPPFTALHAAAQAIGESSDLALAGQNLFWEDAGAFTGEISGPMLKEAGCRYVIVGHSERRHWFGERDEDINKKIRAALRHGLRPILCVGESLTDRERGDTKGVVTAQLEQDLTGFTEAEIADVALAYEPIWAIGTGRAASPAQAVEVHTILRQAIVSHWGHEAGQRIRILYGGSVNATNAREFLQSPGIDGVLVGGACLDPACFATIARFAEELCVNERRGA